MNISLTYSQEMWVRIPPGSNVSAKVRRLENKLNLFLALYNLATQLNNICKMKRYCHRMLNIPATRLPKAISSSSYSMKTLGKH